MPTTLPVLYADGYDVALTGFRASAARGYRDAPEQTWRSAQVLDRGGAVLLDDVPMVATREVTVPGWIFGTSYADALSKLDLLLDRLKAANEIRVSFAGETTRELRARFRGCQLQANPPQFSQRRHPVEIRLECLDPYAYDVNATVVAFGAATAMPIGTGPSRPVLTITGATNPAITYKDKAGVTVATMNLTGSGTFVVDCDLMTVTLGGSPAMDALSNASDFIVLRPQDADRVTPTWGTLAVAGGSGSASYKKAWR